MKVAAVVIWYNPVVEFLDNIASYSQHVDKVIVVDNSPTDNSNLFVGHPEIEYLPLLENRGIAAALNIGLRLASEKGMEWALTMDQDSHFDAKDIEAFLNDEAEHFKQSNVAIFAPITNQNQLKGSRDIDCTITSGSLTNLSIFRDSTGFDESLFIDEVDHEYCYRMKRHGHRIVRLDDIFMHHRLGDPIGVKILGRRFTSSNHGPIRKYYMSRNRLYVRKLYPEFDIPFWKQFVRYIVCVLLLEGQKIPKFLNMARGVIDYKRGKMGKRD